MEDSVHGSSPDSSSLSGRGPQPQPPADASVDLSGAWRLAVAEGDLHQRFAEPTFDDGDWIEANVPGHWRGVPELAGTDGPVLYRRRFRAPRPGPGERVFVTFDGVFYYGDVWLDGGYLGATEGYFAPHSFEVTDALAAGEDHVLAVEVACPPERDRRAKRMLAGVFTHWDNLDPAWNPGGLWRDIRLDHSGAVHIAGLRVLCTEATEDRGRIRLHLTLDAPCGPLPVHLEARLWGHGTDETTGAEHTLAAGENHLVVDLEIERPRRWWPWRYGDQPLYDIDVAVRLDGDVSDRRHLRSAFREVRLDDWQFHVNGERLFVMGANQGPARMALAEAPPSLLAGDVTRAVDANLDLLRLHGHVTRPEFYAAADEAGLLVWQDMPLQWGYARGARKPAAAQARSLVESLGHHPSVVLWCGHNEPFPGPETEPGPGVSPGLAARRSRWRAAAAVALPTWNKDVLDRSVARALHRSDGTRPVVTHSGVLPGPVRSGTDSHLYFGWYTGAMGDLAGALRRWPRLGRFVSEFGAASVPESADFMEPQRWPDLDWPRLAARHSLQKRIFDRLVPAADFATFAHWQAATQAYQAALVQLQIEDLRRLRHRPTGGFCHFVFADGHPGVTWSVLDAERRPKTALAALAAACRTTLPMLDPRSGAVHVANESRSSYDAATIEVEAGGELWRFSGDLPGMSLVYVGTVALPTAPAAATVSLAHPDLADGVRNAYGPVLLEALQDGDAQ